MKWRITLTAFLVLCLALTVMPQIALGQAIYGSISGTITDSTGAAVAGAKVAVTNVRKGVTETTTTNADGNYNVTHLVPDTYNFKAEQQGFKSFEIKDVVVSADTSSHVNGQFTVSGASTEVVEVTGEAPQLKTDRADVATTFNEKAVSELPILNRNFTSFELLSPGTQKITGWSHASTENPQGGQQIFVNGQHFSGTGFLLDGTDNQDPILGIIIVNPTLESVTEAKFSLQAYDAEIGKAVAGIVSTQTKSGSNQYHGSGFWFHRDNAGRATDPFGSKVFAKNIWNQFGGSIGGAVIKDKLFFFGDYQGTRRITGSNLTVTVPTALVRSTCLNPASATCDLSEYVNSGLSGGGFDNHDVRLYTDGTLKGNLVPGGQLYNPNTGVGYYTEVPGDPQHSTIANNVAIPKADFGAAGSIAEGILNLLPAPNTAGNSNGVLDNYSAAGSGNFNDNAFNTRWDYTATQKLTVFGRFSLANFKIAGAPIFGNSIGGPGFGQGGLAGQSEIKNRSIATGFDYAFSNTWLTDFRFGWFQYNPHATKFDQGASGANSLGLPGLNLANDSSTLGLPGLFFDGTLDQASQGPNGNLGESLGVGRCNCPLTERERQAQFVNNWTNIRGNHQIKFGVDLRHATNLRTPSDANRTGELHFSHTSTSDGGNENHSSTVGGLDLGSFLFGTVNSFNRYVGNVAAGELSASEHQNRMFFYGQDTWRYNSKLTINYGLRYEIFSPEAVNGQGRGGFAVLPEGVIRVAGYGGISNNGSTGYATKAFAPRLGIAYQFNSKTVVRMGYGRSFDLGVFGSLFGHTVTQNLPVLANQNLATTNGYTPAFNFVQGPAPEIFPTVPANGILPFRGPLGDVTPRVRPDTVRLPTIDQWNITVQRQLNSTTSVEIGYVANKGTHTFQGNGNTYNANQPSIVGFGTISQSNRRPLNGKFITPYTDANGVTTNVVCCTGDVSYNGNDADNHYNSLQTKLDHRFSHGLQFLAHYTYSRATGSDGSYPLDRAVGTGRDDYNRANVFVATVLYELPFGKGKQFMGSSSKAADLIIGGWQVNSTWTVASGLPYTPSYGECGQDQDTGPCRPSIKGSFSSSTGSFDAANKRVHFFTPVAPLATNGAQSGVFIRPQAGTFGNVARNSFTGPGEFLSDASLFKSFAVTERIKAQIRIEFFNVFNHQVLNSPNNCIDCGGNSGFITSLQGDTAPRQMQVGVHLNF